MEGCSFDGLRLSENQHDSPSVSAVPPCFMAWVPQVCIENTNIWFNKHLVYTLYTLVYSLYLNSKPNSLLFLSGKWLKALSE